MPVAAHRLGSAARLDHHVREEQVRVDFHRRHVRHVDRLLAPAEPLRRVVRHARRRDRDLRRKQVVAPAPAARPEHVLAGDRPAAHDDPGRQKGQHSDYLRDVGLKVRYLHSDIDTIERVEILRSLRASDFDILVGINLLREGLDLPEVSLVCISTPTKKDFCVRRRR